MHKGVKVNYIETVYTLADAQKILRKHSKRRIKHLFWIVLYRIIMPLLCVVVGFIADKYLQAGGISIIMLPAAGYFITQRIED